MILGLIQGLAEWLPVSSEGILVLVQSQLWGSGEGLKALVHQALFLHAGTFLAASVYFRHDIFNLIKTLLGQSGPRHEQKVLHFLIITTLVSGFTGFFLLEAVNHLENQTKLTGQLLTLGIGGLLLITAGLQIKTKKKGFKTATDLSLRDSFLLGLLQGLAVLPGLSRSGLTVSGLLLRKFDKTLALKLSFLMSLPIVFVGNIFLNRAVFSWGEFEFWGFLVSFGVGLLTIHGLLQLAKRVNFGYFVFGLALLTIISLLV